MNTCTNDAAFLALRRYQTWQEGKKESLSQRGRQWWDGVTVASSLGTLLWDKAATEEMSLSWSQETGWRIFTKGCKQIKMVRSSLSKVTILKRGGGMGKKKWRARNGGGSRQTPDQWLERLMAIFRRAVFSDLRCWHQQVWLGGPGCNATIKELTLVVGAPTLTIEKGSLHWAGISSNNAI